MRMSIGVPGFSVYFEHHQVKPFIKDQSKKAKDLFNERVVPAVLQGTCKALELVANTTADAHDYLISNPNPGPLAIVSINPIDGAVGVPLSECPTVDSSGNPVGHCGGTVRVTFNRPVEAGSVGISIKVFGATNLTSGVVECTTPTGGTKYTLCGPGVHTTVTALFVSNTDLIPGTLYQVTLSPSIGYCCLTDSNGNALTGLPIVWLFTTTV